MCLLEKVNISLFDLIVISPGISISHPLVEQALLRNIEVIAEVELALRFCKNKVLAITGTNGKTTTTKLVEHILNKSSKKAVALGNVGKSFCSFLPFIKDEIIVLELSSFQLETMKFPTLEAASILNISHDHLDRYESFEDYAYEKCKIIRFLKKNKILYVNKNTKEKYFEDLKNVVTFENIFKEHEILFFPFLNKIPFENLMAAFCLCKSVNININDFFRNIVSFSHPLHRLEFVENIKGINFYNDSKATNVHAVSYAASKINKNIILIMGGVDKKISFWELNEIFKGKVKSIFAIGQCASRIKNELSNYKVKICIDFKEAIFKAYKVASKNDNILLSPGCSSFDMFDNYEHRGNEFKNIVKQLKKEEAK